MVLRTIAITLALACTPGGRAGHAQRQAAAGDLEGARAALERQRQQQPRSVDVRVALGEVYYRIARDALTLRRGPLLATLLTGALPPEHGLHENGRHHGHGDRRGGREQVETERPAAHAT